MTEPGQSIAPWIGIGLRRTDGGVSDPASKKQDDVAVFFEKTTKKCGRIFRAASVDTVALSTSGLDGKHPVCNMEGANRNVYIELPHSE